MKSIYKESEIQSSFQTKLRKEKDDINLRRYYGEFFTPVSFAKKALDYIVDILGENYWQSGEFRFWDMASGTGNLECKLPNDAHQYFYLSTINEDEIEYCRNLFPDANCFQYDYLNDDVENLFYNENVGRFKKLANINSPLKLPEKLRIDLQNPQIKWIILVNPPFATSQTNRADSQSKQGVSNTKIREEMHRQGLGEVSRELFSQFIFRIKKEFDNKQAYLGLFSKIKYLNATNDQKLREKVFDFTFEKGFMFSSANFSGTSKSNQFPVGFLLWNLSKTQQINNQDIEIDIFNEDLDNIGRKRIFTEDKSNFLSNWIKRPAATIKFPPVGSAINLKPYNIDKRDRISVDFLASFMCSGNNFQCQNKTALFSMPSVSAGAFSVIPDNFEKVMIAHAVRRIPKATWVNDRDQFFRPQGILTDEFITDCVIWNIYSSSNQTVAMRNVTYENDIYQIQNHFFPFMLSEIKKWNITNNNIIISTQNDKDRFVAKWLNNKVLSTESSELLCIGKEIYRYYFENLDQIRIAKFKIETWDAGWWQIRNALTDAKMANSLLVCLKKLHNKLRDNLLLEIEKYRFLK